MFVGRTPVPAPTTICPIALRILALDDFRTATKLFLLTKNLSNLVDLLYLIFYNYNKQVLQVMYFFLIKAIEYLNKKSCL